MRRLASRRNLRRERVFRDRTNPLDIYDDEELFSKFRFRRVHILAMVDELGDDIEYPVARQGSLSPVLQLLLTLRFFATGCFLNMVGLMIGVQQSTASRTIHRVTIAMLTHMRRWVHLPSQQEADRQKAKFMLIAGHPDVIGCIAGTHIRILAPSINAHEYHQYADRTNVHSINVQVYHNFP